MQRFLIYSMALVGMSFFASAQTVNTNDGRDSFESLQQSNGNTIMVFNNAYDGIHGTPYLHNNWFSGGVVMLSGDKYENMKLKYDMMEDNVLVKEKSGKEVFPYNGAVRSFYYTDNEGLMHTFVNLSVADKGRVSDKNGFFELLYEGNNRLYIKRSKYLKHISSKGAYSSNKSYDEFRDKPPEFTLIRADGETAQFIRSKKDVLAALNDTGDLAGYVKKNKLNLKKSADIVLLIKYYDTK